MKHTSIIPLIALAITVSALAQPETSREILRNEMSKRPDDLWPRGEGHVVLAIPGSLEAEKSYLEPGGGFSPAFGAFGVSIWVTSKSADKTWSCDTLPLAAIRQSFVDGKAPSIVTKTDDYELTHSINATGDSSIRVKNTSSAGNTLSLVVRSVGPAGNPVKKLSWDGTDLIINDNWHVAISPKPDSVTMGDETQEGWKNLDGAVAQFTSESGWGFARIRLGKGDYTVRMTTVAKSDRSPIGYDTMASTLKIQLPDERFAQALNAQVSHLMMGVVRDECRPGEPNNYPLPWLRDGAYQLLALARAGQIDSAKTLARYFAKNDFFGGFGPEGDAPGLGIWGIMQVAYEVNDPSFYQELWTHVQRKVEWIRKMRTTKESIRLPITCPVIGQTKRSPDGDLVCEAARDGLIIGRMDWHRPLLFASSAEFV